MLKNIIENKYYKIYKNIIEKAKNRTIEKNSVYEKHHIIPKSLGGLDNKDNIVFLTPKEHFICHALLTKFTKNNEKEKMIKAFIMMKAYSKYNNKRYINSKIYDILKKEYSKYQSAKQKSANIMKDRIWIYNYLINIEKTIDKQYFLDNINCYNDQGWISGRNIKKIKTKKQKPWYEKISKAFWKSIKRYFPDIDFDNNLEKNANYIRDKIYKEYYIDRLSTLDLGKKYGLTTPSNFYKIMKTLKIERRINGRKNKSPKS